MAEGQAISYTRNAQVAAASAKPACGATGCPSCVKAGLPVLLTRLGLADKGYAEARKGVLAPVVKKQGAPDLVASGYVLRTLRAGYVYAYYEKAHTPELVKQNGWQVFRVDHGGYLTPIPLAMAGKDNEAFTCKRSESYATAMLFVIPQPKQTKRVWVGFSTSPWSAPTLKKYASHADLRAKRMACIDAPAGKSEGALGLTAERVGQCLPDYDAALKPEVLRGAPFPRLIPAKAGQANGAAAVASPDAQDQKEESPLFKNPKQTVRPEDAQLLYKQAHTMLEKLPGKPYTDTNLMMVCVPDAEGITTEAAQRRITLCNSAAESVASKEEFRKFQSALQIEGMLKLIEQNGQQHKQRNAGYAKLDNTPITRTQFEAMQKDGRLPPDAELIPGIVKRGVNPNHWYPDYNNGTVHIPNARQIDQDTKDARTRLLGKLRALPTLNGPTCTYDQYLKRYRDKALADQKRLAEVERDYKAWLQSDARKLVTSHDFDEATHIDGVYYAKCVANVTLGGPMSDEGAKWFKPFLTSKFDDKEALLARALLGNQKQFLDWVTDKDQVSKEWDSVKGIMDLEPVKAAVAAGKGALLDDIRSTTQALLGTTTAVVTKLDLTAGQISEKLRYQLKLIAMMAMTRSEADPLLKLMRVQMPLADASRMWNVMRGEVAEAIKRTVKDGRNKVESLLLNSAAAMELNGAPKTAMGMVDMYLMVRDPGAALGKVKQGAVKGARYLVAPAEIYGAKAARSVAQFVDSVTATQWAKGHMKVAASASGVLSAGSGLLQVLLIHKAWGDYASGNEQERLAARMGLLSAGLGLTAALYELRAQYLEHVGKDAAFKAVKRIAGYLAAGSTAVDAAQAYINMSKAGDDGDQKAKYGFGAQLILFALAVGASIAATVEASFLGIGAVAFGGMGLILVAVGVIVGFVIFLIKDKPPETWAAKTIWGVATKKWDSYATEEREVNKVLLCAQIDFSFRWNLVENLGTSAMAAEGAGFFGQEQTYTREAWLRFVLPEALRNRLGWEMRVYVSGTEGEMMVGTASYPGSGAVATNMPRNGITATFTEKSEGGITTLVLSSTVEMTRFRNARGAVQVFTLSGSGQDVGARSLIIDEEIRD
ncbi:T6SS effector BTH_I2691 family protein [Ralstonia solanacearum]|uniref:T6SS effector BTH_I2691 family protein n=1 Tax=Ralstonia solanacearum TaxID=305 RepID=UPI0018D1914C|nr:T6SS effector BTH_I2691 family protein [Ralstonia solanacearum]